MRFKSTGHHSIRGNLRNMLPHTLHFRIPLVLNRCQDNLSIMAHYCSSQQVSIFAFQTLRHCYDTTDCCYLTLAELKFCTVLLNQWQKTFKWLMIFVKKAESYVKVKFLTLLICRNLIQAPHNAAMLSMNLYKCAAAG